MKTIIGFSLFSLGALAQRNIDTDDENPTVRKFNRLNEMLWRSVSGITAHGPKTFRSMLENYGCHCFPGRGNMGQAGQPQDEYDGLCRDLNRCYKCLAMDWSASNFGFWHNYRWMTDADGDWDCSHDRNSEAQKALCNCDAQYVRNLAAIWDDAKFNSTLWRNNRNPDFNFDFETVCQNTGGSPSSACCGAYPYRKPYSADIHECCDDGTVRDSCV